MQAFNKTGTGIRVGNWVEEEALKVRVVAGAGQLPPGLLHL
jgi:hypothetical protein